MAYKNREDFNRWRRETLAKRRTEWLADKSCERCGRTDRLEIHHRDPTDKHPGFVGVFLWSELRRNAELAKCIVLCWFCHRQHHNPRAPHGTHSRYVRGCRCDECRSAHAEQARRSRVRQSDETRKRANAYKLEWKKRKREGISQAMPKPAPPNKLR